MFLQKFFKVPATPEQKRIPFARVNHNKYMVTDKTAYIGIAQLWCISVFNKTALIAHNKVLNEFFYFQEHLTGQETTSLTQQAWDSFPLLKTKLKRIRTSERMSSIFLNEIGTPHTLFRSATFSLMSWEKEFRKIRNEHLEKDFRCHLPECVWKALCQQNTLQKTCMTFYITNDRGRSLITFCTFYPNVRFCDFKNPFSLQVAVYISYLPKYLFNFVSLIVNLRLK